MPCNNNTENIMNKTTAFTRLAAAAMLAAGAAAFTTGCTTTGLYDNATSLNGTAPSMQYSPIKTMRATQKKMMSKPVTRTLPG